MSDTDMEWRTNREFLSRANGDVLIAGLGIGFVIVTLCDKPEVSSITCVELNPDVITLVHPQIRHPKLKVVQGDITEYRQQINGTKFDTIYFDIWGDICLDNLEQMTVLHRKFRACLRKENPNRWIGSWSKPELQRLKRRGW